MTITARSTHANYTADQRAERRARRAPRRNERRQGTLSAIIAADLADAIDLPTVSRPPLVRSTSGSIELRRAA